MNKREDRLAYRLNEAARMLGVSPDWLRYGGETAPAGEPELNAYVADPMDLEDPIVGLGRAGNDLRVRSRCRRLSAASSAPPGATGSRIIGRSHPTAIGTLIAPVAPSPTGCRRGG